MIIRKFRELIPDERNGVTKQHYQYISSKYWYSGPSAISLSEIALVNRYQAYDPVVDFRGYR